MNQNSNNLDVNNNADGVQVGGGVVKRILKWLGGDITLTGGGSAVITLPSTSDTLVGRATTDTLTNKDLSSATNTFPTNLLGYAEITSTFSTTSTGQVQVTGLTKTVTIPSGGRYIRVTVYTVYLTQTNAGGYVFAALWDGTVGSGTELSRSETRAGAAKSANGAIVSRIYQPSAGSHTFNVGLSNDGSGGTVGLGALSAAPAYLLIELL